MTRGRIYPDYPTLSMGPEGHTTEMFGSEAVRLRDGTFHTEDGPWVFTRSGAGTPRGAVDRGTYEPYRA